MGLTLIPSPFKSIAADVGAETCLCSLIASEPPPGDRHYISHTHLSAVSSSVLQNEESFGFRSLVHLDDDSRRELTLPSVGYQSEEVA